MRESWGSPTSLYALSSLLNYCHILGHLLQVALNSSPGFASGSLSILSKGVLESRAGTLQSFINLPEAENEIERFVDVEMDDDEGGRDPNSGKIPMLEDPYDPTSRDPLHCRAEKSSLWELCVLNQHFHPTVQKYAEELLVKEKSVQCLGKATFTRVWFARICLRMYAVGLHL